MPTPLPTASETLLGPPSRDEVQFIARGLVSACRPHTGLTDLQTVVIEAITKSMTGVEVDTTTLEPLAPDAFAEGLRRRDQAFRTRLVQIMELGNMILTPPDPAVAEQVETFAVELNADHECIRIAREVAEGSRRLAAIDFDRNRYLSSIADDAVTAAHTTGGLEDTWSGSVIDADLAARWQSLSELAPDSIGRKVHNFYVARGFAFPGEEGSAPPLLAQHDWVHVLADFGTTVESELEVFGFISRASDDPEAFALLAMVINLFETGQLDHAAGIFEADAGHLSACGVPWRLADSLRRGALTDGSVDFLAVDWFDLAEQTPEQLRDHFGVRPKAEEAVRAGSVGPWDPGGISPFQVRAGRALADDRGREYRSFGATPTS
ncbi:hypothetical protein [Euzebya tangerina]|uniref:hypothetical protein n=1 Tax=Euzebya tangerina TaxID=591198 RepID=UPI0013C3708C|nr:hypothetical protein [Euzebya tangerina]